jgi:hypothetical protein
MQISGQLHAFQRRRFRKKLQDAIGRFFDSFAFTAWAPAGRGWAGSVFESESTVQATGRCDNKTPPVRRNGSGDMAQVAIYFFFRNVQLLGQVSGSHLLL